METQDRKRRQPIMTASEPQHVLKIHVRQSVKTAESGKEGPGTIRHLSALTIGAN